MGTKLLNLVLIYHLRVQSQLNDKRHLNLNVATKTLSGVRNKPAVRVRAISKLAKMPLGYFSEALGPRKFHIVRKRGTEMT